MKAPDQQIHNLRDALAAELLQRDAVKINLDSPFLLTSGNYSPIYINCRQLISSRSTVRLIVAAATLELQSSRCTFDLVAGGESAGIPFAAFLADAFDRPMIYVRKAARTHGLESRIEGVLPVNSRVLLVEDLITDGKSKLSFVSGIRECGGAVDDAIVILDRMQGGAELLREKGVRLISLTNIDVVLRVATEWQLMPSSAIESVRSYLNSPADWHAAQGLPYLQAREQQ